MSNKKRIDVKNKRPESTASKIVIDMNRHFLSGDFYRARVDARRVLASSDETSEAYAAAKHILKLTWPDPMALLAGAVSAGASIAVAFLAAY